jgi:hypothetical protein
MICHVKEVNNDACVISCVVKKSSQCLVVRICVENYI